MPTTLASFLDSWFWTLLALGSVFTCLCSILGFLGRTWWRFDLFSHFRAQYFGILFIISVIFIIGEHFPLSVFSILFAWINLMFLLPLYFGKPAFKPQDQRYRILLANLLQPNRKYEKLRQLIAQTNPDLIVMVEINQTWLDELNKILEKYIYRHAAIREDHYGIAIISKIPLHNLQISYFSSAKVPTLITEAEVNGKLVTLIATHPPPPKSKPEADYRDEQMQKIAQDIRSRSGLIMLLGDLNMSSWSYCFQDFIRLCHLRDSRKGYGIQATWPTYNPFFRVPLDHILISSGITVIKRYVGPSIGSDHFPVIMDFIIDSNHEPITLHQDIP